ncbi:MAG: hypothetical protein ACLQDM_32330 [Bradyrhizobium sp.]
MQMVNSRFPAPIGYGFEMVDAARDAILPAETGINRKFTPNQIIRIFRELSAI